MNLRVLVHLSLSNFEKYTHKWNPEGDSCWILVKNVIEKINEKRDYHFYVLVPHKEVWDDHPENVTLIEYPYMNDALNNRYHFDIKFLNDYFSTYRHDIDLVWTNIPEVTSNIKAFLNKRREEIPIYAYSHWFDSKDNNYNYQPSYRFRTAEALNDCSTFGVQSTFMKNEVIDQLNDDFNTISDNEDKFEILYPPTSEFNEDSVDGQYIGFPHRISNESNFEEMFDLIKPHLNRRIWVTNINKASIDDNDHIVENFIEDRDEYIEELSTIKFGVSYHTGYSMWSMSVVDMMMAEKVVLAPNKNAFPEMFPDDYPFLFDDEDEFIELFKYLQSTPNDEFREWEHKNREQALKYTFDSHAQKLINIWERDVGEPRTDKTESVYEQIEKYNHITKQQLINNNLTDYRRMCSRAWNKSRIELMQNYGVTDDHTEEESFFYLDEQEYRNGEKHDIDKVPTNYEKRQMEDDDNE